MESNTYFRIKAARERKAKKLANVLRQAGATADMVPLMSVEQWVMAARVALVSFEISAETKAIVQQEMAK